MNGHSTCKPSYKQPLIELRRAHTNIWRCLRELILSEPWLLEVVKRICATLVWAAA